jgi:hypothetical protein
MKTCAVSPAVCDFLKPATQVKENFESSPFGGLSPVARYGQLVLIDVGLDKRAKDTVQLQAA